MKTRMRWLIAMALLALGLMSYAENTNHLSKDIFTKIQGAYYSEPQFNSEKIFNGFLKAMDPDRLYFTAEDVAAEKKYIHDFNPSSSDHWEAAADQLFHLGLERREQNIHYNLELLKNGINAINFKEPDSFVRDRSKEPWVAAKDQKKLWLQNFKWEVLNLKESDKEMTNQQIQELLTKRYAAIQEKLNHDKKDENRDAFNMYIEDVLLSLDPHSDYLPPEMLSKFDELMSLNFVGIGAQLREKPGHIIIEDLVTGGPAEKEGSLQPGDEILMVSDKKLPQSMVDVVGKPIDDVVDMIRGKKGTPVILKVVSKDGEHKEIKIIRNEVVMSDEKAQLKMLDVTRDHKVYKIGILKIPSFYFDFDAEKSGKKDYASVFKDVKKALNDQKNSSGKDTTDALVIDLRDNPGGSLEEVVSIVGLFVNQEPGPIVYTKNKRPFKGLETEVMEDDASGILYDRPMIVLVNQHSASAAEIFAGAIQAYHRGLIVGQTSFGKGSVQSLMPVDESSSGKKEGALKFTTALYYLPDGSSPQFKGIVPEIVNPEPSADDDRENKSDNAFPVTALSTIDPYQASQESYPVDRLKTQNLARTQNSIDFQYIQQLHDFDQQVKNQKVVSLNEDEFFNNAEKQKQDRLAIENNYRHAKGLPAVTSLDGLEKQDEKTIDTILQTGAAEIAADDLVLKNEIPVSHVADKGANQPIN